jgi:hypothetical protein
MGMIAALIPIVVPTTSWVNGITVAISTRNGSDRPRFAVQLTAACICGRGLRPCGEVLKISTPSGRPSATTMLITIPTIAAVWPSAGRSNADTPDHGVAVPSAIMPPSVRGEG